MFGGLIFRSIDDNLRFIIKAADITSFLENLSDIMNTPILLITFNRPEQTRKVLSAIREAKPEELFIAQDGAREGNQKDIEQCSLVRHVISEMIDWNCNLHTRFSEVNLGCGPGPATAITWFFDHVEQGIIIEDDALPHPDFFLYCEELLLKYKDDNDVRAIGSMHLDNLSYGDGSYYFSMMNRTLCAWATWSRAWKDFDYYHRNISRKQLNQVLKGYGCALRMREYWCDRLAEIQKDALKETSWDQQFWISIWLHKGKGIMPNVNLCKNIGFDQFGTHTTNPNSIGANRETHSILPLKHPTDESVKHKSDQRFQEIYFEPWNYGREGRKRLVFRLNKRMKRLIGHEGPWLKKKTNK